MMHRTLPTVASYHEHRPLRRPATTDEETSYRRKRLRSEREAKRRKTDDRHPKKRVRFHENQGDPPTGRRYASPKRGASPDQEQPVIDYTFARADHFIRFTSESYRTASRAEDRKRILSEQLPKSLKSDGFIGHSFIFCTATDGDVLEAEIASIRRDQDRISDFERLDRAIKSVSCRIRRRPTPSKRLNDRQVRTIRAARAIAVAFNRIIYVSRIKHHCEREARIWEHLRDQLNRRCREGSRLTSGVRRFIASVDPDRHRKLCLVLVGILAQTPHMWARSVRLLNRIKLFYQNATIKLLADERIDLREAFEMQYQPTAYKILHQVLQYSPSILTPTKRPDGEARPSPQPKKKMKRRASASPRSGEANGYHFYPNDRDRTPASTSSSSEDDGQRDEGAGDRTPPYASYDLTKRTISFADPFPDALDEYRIIHPPSPSSSESRTPSPHTKSRPGPPWYLKRTRLSPVSSR